MTDRPRAFSTAFKPAQPISDENGFAEFHRFLAPTEGETPAAYAVRLQVNGLAIYAGTSEEIRNDIAEYKAAMDTARADNVPVIHTTGIIGAPAGDDPRTAEDPAKADALAQARATNR